MEAITMNIPSDATQAGQMISNITNGVPQSTREIFRRLLINWQSAVNFAHYVREEFTFPADQVHGTFGKQYARLDIGSSGAFMVHIDSGIIYGIKGYGKVDRKKIVGNIYEGAFDADVLVRDRFRSGRFANNPNGSVLLGS